MQFTMQLKYFLNNKVFNIKIKANNKIKLIYLNRLILLTI